MGPHNVYTYQYVTISVNVTGLMMAHRKLKRVAFNF
jgi:hypothetical protein